MQKQYQSSVLLVDDNRELVGLLGSILEFEGYTVHRAYSGEEALTTAGVTKPNFVLTDTEMPGMSGFELSAALTRSPGGPVVYVCSASPQPDLKKRAEDAGAQGFLPKPIKSQQLIDIIASHSFEKVYN